MMIFQIYRLDSLLFYRLLIISVVLLFVCGITQAGKIVKLDRLELRARAVLESDVPRVGEPLSPKRQNPLKQAGKAPALYQKYCQKCHDKEGTGAEGRNTFPSIPDFTSKHWQEKRSDAQLQVSILDGKGTSMPPFGDKLDEEKAKELREFVRDFAAK
jgi:mono/diheme cytochrome c family protein